MQLEYEEEEEEEQEVERCLLGAAMTSRVCLPSQPSFSALKTVPNSSSATPWSMSAAPNSELHHSSLPLFGTICPKVATH